jgi:hypothetical protein
MSLSGQRRALVRENRKLNSVAPYFVINRETGGLHYCLVSDLNEKELAELANLFGRWVRLVFDYTLYPNAFPSFFILLKSLPPAPAYSVCEIQHFHVHVGSEGDPTRRASNAI